MKLSKIIIFTAMLLVSACAAQSSPPQTLKEKLAATAPEERTRTIRNICLTEAEWRQDQLISYNTRHYGGTRARSNLPYMPDVVRLKDICWEMTALYSAEKR
jgi:hypothetical protein